MLKSEAWNRGNRGTSTGDLTKGVYSILLGCFIMAGIMVCALSSWVSRNWDASNSWVALAFCVAALAFALIGVRLANKSDKPNISFVGYALVAIPFGLFLGPVVAQHTTTSVLRVLLLTMLVAGVLGVVGAIIPRDLSSWINWLLGGVVLLLVGLVGIPVLGAFGVPIGGAMTAMDWIGTALFSALVVFDMNRAMRMAYTVDNAVDAALAVFLDVLNIFMFQLGEV